MFKYIKPVNFFKLDDNCRKWESFRSDSSSSKIFMFCRIECRRVVRWRKPDPRLFSLISSSWSDWVWCDIDRYNKSDSIKLHPTIRRYSKGFWISDKILRNFDFILLLLRSRRTRFGRVAISFTIESQAESFWNTLIQLQERSNVVRLVNCSNCGHSFMKSSELSELYLNRIVFTCWNKNIVQLSDFFECKL